MLFLSLVYSNFSSGGKSSTRIPSSIRTLETTISSWLLCLSYHLYKILICLFGFCHFLSALLFWLIWLSILIQVCVKFHFQMQQVFLVCVILLWTVVCTRNDKNVFNIAFRLLAFTELLKCCQHTQLKYQIFNTNSKLKLCKLQYSILFKPQN